MKRILLLLLLGVFSLAIIQNVNASILKKREVKTAKVTPKSIYSKLFGDPKTHIEKKGIITIHLYDNKIYLEIPITLMGKSFVASSDIESASDFALSDRAGAKPRQIVIDKTDSLVLFMNPKPNVSFDNTNEAQKKALNMSQTASIIDAFPIKGYNTDSTTVIFEATSFFSGNNKDMLDLKGKSYIDMLSISDCDVQNNDSSYINAISAYDRSVSVTQINNLSLSFSIMGLETTDKKDATVSLHMSLTLLPDKMMTPRPANSYIGSGYVDYTDYPSNNSSKTEYYAIRRNLSQKSITVYVDSLFRPSWTKAIKLSADEWNKVFKKAGIDESIVIKPFAKDSMFHADDPLINTIQLANGDKASINEYNVTDPRSGEILGSKISIGRDFAKTVRRKGVCQMADVDERFRTYDMPDDLVCEALKGYMLKALGLSLGLDANYAGSYAYTPQQLRSPEFTKKYGITASVMDDVLYNYLARPGDKEKGVVLVVDKPGVYDEFAIQYLYANIGDNSKKALNKWVEQHQSDMRLFYGKAPISIASDPRSQRYDLGNDPIADIDAIISHVKYVIKHAAEWYNKLDASTTEYKELFPDYAFLELYNIIHSESSYIGGVYLNEADANSLLPSYKSVPRELQQKIVNKILSVCNNLKWLDTNRDFLYLGGYNTSMSNWTYQSGIPMQDLFSRLSKMNLSVSKSFKPYLQQEYLNDIEKYLFKDFYTGKPMSAEKLLQTGQYINGLIDLSPSLNSIKKKYMAASIKNFALSSDMDKPHFSIYDFSFVPPFENTETMNEMETENVGQISSISYYVNTDIDGICYSRLQNIRKILQKAELKSKDVITKGKYDYLIQLINRVM